MTQMNLLPWREKARQDKKKQFGLVVAGSAALALFFVFMLHLHYKNSWRHQQNRNEYLQSAVAQEETEFTSLKKKMKVETALISELNGIISMREKSYQAVRLLDELVRIVPESVSLNKLIREGNTLTLIGKAKSNLQITYFMKNIAKSRIFKQPVLTEISAKEKNVENERYFQLKIEQQESPMNE